MKCAQELQKLYESDIVHLNVPKSVSDFVEAFRKKDNPLSQGLPLTSNNIFVEIVRYGIKENRELIQTILKHTACNTQDFDGSMVRHIAKMYIQMGSKSNRKNNTFKKLQGIFLQSCGLNNVGLEALSKLGETESPRNLLDTRTQLAIVDE